MNDQFLHRLREPPPLRFATALKAKLDLRAAAAATRKRFLYLMSSLVIGGTALAFVSPSVRQFVASTLERSDASSTLPDVRSQIQGPATMTPDTASQVSTVFEKQREAPQYKDVERPSEVAAPSPVRETQQAANWSSSRAGAPGALLTASGNHASVLDADIAVISVGSRVRVDGAGATAAIFKAAGEEFEILTKQKVLVVPGVSGTESGFKKLCRGDVDIVGATRPILKPEMGDCAAAGTKFIELPIAYEALAVIVNNNATWISEITTAELKKLWEPAAQGRVVRWNQINDAWPNQSLQLFSPRSNPSLLDYFTESIVGQPKATRGDYIGTELPNIVTNGVSQYSGAIGYVSYASFAAHRTQVKALKIVNSSGEAVSPSEAALVDASYNPLSRPLLIYVNAGRAKRPEIKAFLKFVFTKGAKAIGKANDIPLPADMYETALAKFANGKAGTVFDGKSAIGVQLDEALAREPVL